MCRRSKCVALLQIFAIISNLSCRANGITQIDIELNYAHANLK